MAQALIDTDPVKIFGETRRWTPLRKLKLVDAIASGEISPEDAMRIYSISSEELEGWQQQIEDGGTSRLRISIKEKYGPAFNQCWRALFY